MKLLTITKKGSIKFKAYIFNNGFIDIIQNHKRYSVMVKDVLDNNFKNKVFIREEIMSLNDGMSYKRDIYESEELKGETPLEKLEVYLNQFNELYNYELVEEPMYKYLIGKQTSKEEFLSIYTNDNWDISYPIDMEKFVKSIGIKLIKTPDFKNPKRMGRAYISQGKPIIEVNLLQNDNIGRRRFTISHELGHFVNDIFPQMGEAQEEELAFDDTKETMEFNRDENWNPIEMYANRFAADFLMPKEIVLSQFDDLHAQEIPINEIVSELAASFKVSLAAMRIRLESLGKI